jgi:hypothetical protein
VSGDGQFTDTVLSRSNDLHQTTLLMSAHVCHVCHVCHLCHVCHVCHVHHVSHVCHVSHVSTSASVVVVVVVAERDISGLHLRSASVNSMIRGTMLKG